MEVKKTLLTEQPIDPADNGYFDRKYFQQDWARTFPDHPKGEDNFKRTSSGM